MGLAFVVVIVSKQGVKVTTGVGLMETGDWKTGDWIVGYTGKIGCHDAGYKIQGCRDVCVNRDYWCRRSFRSPAIGMMDLSRR